LFAKRVLQARVGEWIMRPQPHHQGSEEQTERNDGTTHLMIVMA